MPISLASTSAGSMHGAMVPIATYTASGSSNYIALTNIPQVYQDLFLVINARSSNTGTTSAYSTWFNAQPSSSTNFSQTFLDGNGSAGTSGRNTTSTPTYGVAVNFPGASSTSGIFGSAEIHILNYRNTSTYKTILQRSAADLNGSGITELAVNLWQNTSAITEIDFSGTGNFVSGTTLNLYGIRTVGQ
jgi:hypothetical protein